MDLSTKLVWWSKLRMFWFSVILHILYRWFEHFNEILNLDSTFNVSLLEEIPPTLQTIEKVLERRLVLMEYSRYL